MVVLLQIGRRHVGVATAERLVANRLVAARALDIGRAYFLLLLDRQGEELMRLAVEVGDHLRRNAVAGDSEETDVSAGLVDQLAEASARATVGGAGVGKIDSGNLGCHGLQFPYVRCP